MDNLRKQSENNRHPSFSLTKAKKYETLIIQIWELLPIFCRFNSPKLSEAFSALIAYLEVMINKNVLNLRLLALKVFSEIMSHCHKTSVVTDQIKKTRVGLQNISIDYV